MTRHSLLLLLLQDTTTITTIATTTTSLLLLHHSPFLLRILKSISPPEFLNDEDILMGFLPEKEKPTTNNKGSSTRFYGFGSDLSSPVESVMGSTETESDEEDYLTGLTRKLRNSTLSRRFLIIRFQFQVLTLFWLCLLLHPSSKLIHGVGATVVSVDRRGGGGGGHGGGGGGHGGGGGGRGGGGGGSRGGGRDPGFVVIPVYAGAGAHRQSRTHGGRNNGGGRNSAALPQLGFTLLALVVLLCF
ncbi:hypothetical protein OSB04_009410 [Centaurea solstitialis]|uniref:Glycine-rich protein n=1 Tax=Centaurea solstitialis TaxID=347529 RepID=A0AA38WNC8_9ASTR|nr:hypothetical protein OSB04_009410 [Centaurea solstitialis]